MTAQLTRSESPDREGGVIEASMRSEGLEPHRWGNAPGDRYDWHSHGYDKVLYCTSGSITFHVRGGDDQGVAQDFELRPGDRLDIEAGTEHAATVGPGGVECIEATR